MSIRGRRRLRDGRELSVHTNGGLRKVCACPRRNWAKCRHGWHLSYAWKGRQYRFSLARHLGRAVTSRTEAEAEADRIRTAIREGRFVVGAAAEAVQPRKGAEGGGLTFAAYGELFLSGYSQDRGKASWKDDGYLMKRLMAFVTGGRKIVASEDVRDPRPTGKAAPATGDNPLTH